MISGAQSSIVVVPSAHDRGKYGQNLDDVSKFLSLSDVSVLSTLAILSTLSSLSEFHYLED